MPAQSPIAFARSCGGNVTVMIDRVPGMSSAPPIPWMNLKEMSWPVVCDRPQASEAVVNMARPVRNIFLRP